MFIPNRLAILALGLITVAPATAHAQQLSDSLAGRLITVQRWNDGSSLRATAGDTATARQLAPMLAGARRQISAFFGAPFTGPVAITLVPGRAAFSDALKRTWSMPQTECWMVAAGVADFVIGISPRTWPTDACDHGTDSTHVRQIFTHELVHAFHGQHHASRDFDFPGADDLGWLIEGVAVYASGQLDSARLDAAIGVVRASGGPARLADGWSGNARYGVAGSLLRYIDERWGRPMLLRLLPSTTNAAVLAALGTDETTFLADWRAWLLRR